MSLSEVKLVATGSLMDDGSKVLNKLICIVALVHFTFVNLSGVNELNDHFVKVSYQVELTTSCNNYLCGACSRLMSGALESLELQTPKKRRTGNAQY